MSSTVALPTGLRDRLGAVARRVRLLRALRGLSLVTVVLGISAAAAFLTDYFLPLPPLVRAIALAAWAGLGVASVIVGILMPLSRRLDLDGLAGVVEERYPELAERLLSSVDLARESDEGNGDQKLVAQLIADTDRSTSRLDFLAAVPGRSTLILGGAALATLLLFAVPAVLMPHAMARLTGRFFRPFQPIPAPYTLTVEPGDKSVMKGDELKITVTAALNPDSEQTEPAGSCVLTFTNGAGKESRLTLEPHGNGVFTASTTVIANFTYRAEAGGVVSPTFKVKALQNIGLAVNSPTVDVVLPPYARETRNKELKIEQAIGLVDLPPVLRFSEIQLDVAFTRPAVAAYVVWHEGRWFQAPATTILPLTLNEDHTGGSITLPARAAARYEIVIEAENGVRVTVPGSPRIPVRDDLAPSFAKASLSDKPGVVRLAPAYDSLKIDALLADDVAPQRLVLEMQVGKVISEHELKLEDVERKAEATVLHAFKLGTLRLKEGDVVSYRLRGEDGLPAALGGPHKVFYPAKGWLTIKITKDGATSNEKEIADLRDEIRRRLEALRVKLAGEERAVNKVLWSGEKEENLNVDLKQTLGRAQKDNGEIHKELNKIGQLTEPIEDLQILGDLVKALAAEELTRSGQDLDQATRQKTAPPRTTNLKEADKELIVAQRKLDELLKLNDKLAQERMDRARLATLAEREQQLADRARELLEKDQARDPEARKEAEDIKQEQQKVAQELERLTNQSEALRAALEQTRSEQARELADKARELARAERELAKDSTATEQKRASERLAELAKKQEELAEKARRFDAETHKPAAAANIKPINPEDAAKAAELLKKGDAEEAVKRQDKAAQDLDRVANAFDKPANLNKDPREAARQLAKLQEDLSKRTQQEIQKQDPRPLAERLKALEAEQKDISRAAEHLAVPAQKEQARQEQRNATDKANQAAQQLDKNNAKEALAQMEQAKNALNRLADQLPDLAQRQREAREAVAQLRQKQDQVARETEQAQKQAAEKPKDAQAQANLDRQLAQQAKAQAEIAEKFSKLDVPRQAERQERAKEALNNALRDLLDTRKEDIPASQQQARRELEKLDQALRGEKPADEKAQELAQRQHDLANQAAKLAQDPMKATPQQKQDLQRQQAEVARQTRELQAPEAPQRQAEAADATQKAEQAAQKDPTSPQTARQLEQAARKLDDLAKQLNGQENDAAKADRLAQKQAEAAAQAARDAKEHPNQAPTQEAQKRQDAIAREAQQLRGGEEARAEKQKATDALQKAQEGNAEQRAQAEGQAADALRDLADKLAGRNDPAAKAAEVAREQRDLANQAAQQPMTPQTPQQAKQAAQAAADRQAELKRQLDRGNPGEKSDAQKQAAARMQEAQQALNKANNPGEAKEPLNRAAEAAEKLAQQLAQNQGNKPNKSTSAKPFDQSPRKNAQQLAQAQRDLAKATQQAQERARQQPGEQGQKALNQELQRLAQKQDELNRQATQVPSDRNQQALQQAREAMNEARAAFNRNDANQANQKQNEAAQALDRLSQKLPAQAQRPAAAQPAEANPRNLPTRQQAEEARQLAKEQRELRDQVQRSNEAARAQDAQNRNNPAPDLARQQAEIARQAGELAQRVDQEKGANSPQAQQAQQARQTAEQTQSGAPQARQSGEQSAEQLRQLADKLQEGGQQTPNAEKAADLAQRQAEINRQRQDPAVQRAEQQQRQQDLQAQTAKLAQDLGKLGAEMSRAPMGQQPGQQTEQAAQQAQQAQQAMQQARDQAQQGNNNAARQSQEQAAQALDRAAQRAQQASGQPMGQPMAGQPMGGQPMAGQPMGGEPMAGQPTPGQATQQAQGQIQQAQNQLNQGQGQQAQSSMQSAAQSLQQASQSLGNHPPGPPHPSNQPGEPGQAHDMGIQASGVPDSSLLPPDLKKYAGTEWGKLPGEVRTRIVQQLQTRYGDDHAQMIKLYFEQIAANKKK